MDKRIHRQFLGGSGLAGIIKRKPKIQHRTHLINGCMAGPA